MDATDIEPATGVLLIAAPALADPNFRRSVVLLCDHGEEGTFGLVLNRPLTLRLSDVMDEVEQYDDTLSLGGPVEQNTLHYLHRHGDIIPNAVHVVHDIYWGGEFATIKALISSGQLQGQEDLRFFLGYAGWGPEQLSDEIGLGGWILDHADAEAIFSVEPSRLWRTVLRRMGGDFALIANFPDDPRLN